jgi:hypothetical protein
VYRALGATDWEDRKRAAMTCRVIFGLLRAQRQAEVVFAVEAGGRVAPQQGSMMLNVISSEEEIETWSRYVHPVGVRGHYVVDAAAVSTEKPCTVVATVSMYASPRAVEKDMQCRMPGGALYIFGKECTDYRGRVEGVCSVARVLVLGRLAKEVVIPHRGSRLGTGCLDHAVGLGLWSHSGKKASAASTSVTQSPRAYAEDR